MQNMVYSHYMYNNIQQKEYMIRWSLVVVMSELYAAASGLSQVDAQLLKRALEPSSVLQRFKVDCDKRLNHDDYPHSMKSILSQVARGDIRNWVSDCPAVRKELVYYRNAFKGDQLVIDARTQMLESAHMHNIYGFPEPEPSPFYLFIKTCDRFHWDLFLDEIHTTQLSLADTVEFHKGWEDSLKAALLSLLISYQEAFEADCAFWGPLEAGKT